MTTASLLVSLGTGWLWLGAATAIIFLSFGIDRVDEDARDAYIFRPLLIPAILLIWPLVLWRWWQIERQGEVTMARYRAVRRSHGIAAIVMTGLIAAVLVLGLTARQDWPETVPPVRIDDGGAS